ncbi:MAG: hypothetical protein IJW31_09280 [Lentisphaeria bacterium]|nr:hypothetical protein [Lentisphaeria bacterium]
MKKLFLTLFTAIVGIALWAGENLLPDLTQWSKDGAGNFVVEADSASITHKGGQKAASLQKKIQVEGGNYYIFSGKIKKTSENTKPSVSFIARTEKNAWLFQYIAPGINEAKVGEWQEFEIRAFLTPIADNITAIIGSYKDGIEIKDIKFEKTDWKNGRDENAPKLEYWINMDYNDNIAYSHNLGLNGYEEKDIVKYFQDCKKAGVTGVQWRISVFGHVLYHSKGAATVFPGSMDVSKLSGKAALVADTIKRIDPLAIAVREAKKNGIELYVWLTLSDEGYKRDVPNYCFPEFLIQNPDCHLLDRQGKPLYGTLCYNEPKAREYRLNMIKEILEYGADGLYLCTRSHSSVFGSDKGDDYGFNKAIVDEYKKRYGVDILTQDFDVVKWRELKAEGFDTLIKEISELAKAKNQKVRLGVASMSLSNGILGGNWGKTPLHWQKFLANDWIDSIVDGQYNVEPYFAGRENNRFRCAAKAHQKLYFWAQMVRYGERVYSYEELTKQAEFFAFYGANGAIYHESVNLEEAPNKYLFPLGVWYSEFDK